MPVVRNDRSGQTINSHLSHEEAARRYVEWYGKQNHWLLFWIHRYALDVPGSPLEAAQVANERQEGLAALHFLSDLFLLAMGRGLKRPMIRLHYKDRRFKIYLSKKGTVCIKSGGLHILVSPDVTRDPPISITYTHDPMGDEEYMGCLLNGRFLPARDFPQQTYRERYGRGSHYTENEQSNRRQERELLPTEREFLDRLGANPTTFFAECSKDMDRCCYCGQGLDDVRSKTVGYGPVCAKNWGLSWGKNKDGQHVPSFAEIYNSEVRAFCATIRDNPDNPGPWAVFNDWLMERGVPPLKIVAEEEHGEVREDGSRAKRWVMKWQPFQLART